MGRFFIIAIWVLLCLTVYAWTYTPQAAAMLKERTPPMTNPKHTDTSRSGDLVERLRECCRCDDTGTVWSRGQLPRACECRAALGEK